MHIPGQTANLLHFRIPGIATTRITASWYANGPMSIGVSTRIRAALPDVIQPIADRVISGAAFYSQESCSPFPDHPAGTGRFSDTLSDQIFALLQCKRTVERSGTALPGFLTGRGQQAIRFGGHGARRWGFAHGSAKAAYGHHHIRMLNFRQISSRRAGPPCMPFDKESKVNHSAHSVARTWRNGRRQGLKIP